MTQIPLSLKHHSVFSSSLSPLQSVGCLSLRSQPRLHLLFGRVVPWTGTTFLYVESICVPLPSPSGRASTAQQRPSAVGCLVDSARCDKQSLEARGSWRSGAVADRRRQQAAGERERIRLAELTSAKVNTLAKRGTRLAGGAWPVGGGRGRARRRHDEQDQAARWRRLGVGTLASCPMGGHAFSAMVGT